MKEQINIFQTVMGGWLFPVMWKVRLYGRIRKCGWNLYWSVGSRVGGALYRHHYIDASDTRWHRGDVSEGPNHCHCAHSVSCDIARISCMTCTYWLIDFSQHNDDVNLKVFSKFFGGVEIPWVIKVKDSILSCFMKSCNVGKETKYELHPFLTLSCLVLSIKMLQFYETLTQGI